MTKRFQLFATCLPGLEELLASEMAGLALDNPQVDAGGVGFSGDLADVYRANLGLGLASQVLLRVGQFHCRSLGELVRKTAALPLENVLRRDRPVQIKVSARKSRLYHSGAIAERVIAGIRARLGDGVDVSKDGALLRVRMQHDECSLSLDSSGDPLYRRGYRQHFGSAPLRADLARALVLLSGWDQTVPLLDPFMGSGVVLIESALLARNLAPGRLRSFGFFETALFDAELWARVRDQVAADALMRCPVRLLGSDRDPRSVASAVENARAAGVLSDLELVRANLSEGMDRSERAIVVTNPPYGRRLGTPQTLARLYNSLGSLVGARSWPITLLAMDRRLALRTGLPLRSLGMLDNGGLKVRVLGWSPAST